MEHLSVAASYTRSGKKVPHAYISLVVNMMPPAVESLTATGLHLRTPKVAMEVIARHESLVGTTKETHKTVAVDYWQMLYLMSCRLRFRKGQKCRHNVKLAFLLACLLLSLGRICYEKCDHSQCSRLPEYDRGVLHERNESPLLDKNALQGLQGLVLLGGAGARVGQVEILDPLECVLWCINRRRRYVYLVVHSEGGDSARVNPQLRNNQ